MKLYCLNRNEQDGKLNIHLQSMTVFKTVWNSITHANLIYHYCLPGQIINLKQFDFYICCRCKSLKNTFDEIIYSFQFHPFFLNHQWTNIKCFFDPILSYQLLSSSIYKVKFDHDFM
jgi:hypothetical protein